MLGRHKTAVALFAIVSIIAIITGAALLGQSINKGNARSSAQSNNQVGPDITDENISHNPSEVNIVYTPAIVELVNGRVLVNASSYYSIEFSLKDFSWARLDGNFTVSGDSVDCVRLYILDNANFSRWLANESFDPFYDSGEVNAADVYVLLLPNTTYQLVFDSTFSSFDTEIDSQIDMLVQSK